MVDSTLGNLSQGTLPNLYYGDDQSGVSRKFQSDRVFNVRDYGALGDYSHDDTTNIENALVAAAALSPPGGTIYFPPGRYKITLPLNWAAPGSVVLLGAGKNCSSIEGNFQGYCFTQQGPIGFGSGATVSITGAANNGAGLIRLTITGSSASGSAPSPTCMIAPNTPYLISGLNGTGNIGGLNGYQSFTIFDATHIDVVGVAFSGTWSSGGDIAGGTQTAQVYIAHLAFNNSNAAVNSGCIYIGYAESISTISDCYLTGFVCANLSSNPYLQGSFGVGIYDCRFAGVGTVGLADKSNTGYAGMPPGSCAVYLGEGVAVNCRAQGFETGYALSGVASGLYQCSVERSNTGVLLGARADASTSVDGAVVSGCQFERIQTGIQVANAVGAQISGNMIQSFSGTPDYATGVFTRSGGTVTVTTTNPHNLGPATTVVGINLDGTSGTFNPGLGGDNIVATVTGASTFTYSWGSGTGPITANWNLAPVFSIWTQTAQNCVISGNFTNAFYGPLVSVELNSFGSATQTNNVLMGCDCSAGLGLPEAANKASWKIMSIGTASVGPSLSMNFADLPGQAGVNQGGGVPVEGMEYDIVNGLAGNCADGTCTTFGTNVTGGGGALRLKVRWNAAKANWTLMGA